MKNPASELAKIRWAKETPNKEYFSKISKLRWKKYKMAKKRQENNRELPKDVSNG